MSVQLTLARSLTTRDGATLAWREAGQGAPTLVFLHGWTCTQETWGSSAATFSRTHRVITFDMAGHGASGTTTRPWTPAEFGKDALAVIDASGANEVVLIGHSMGGAVALEAAQLLPRQVVGVVGVDSFTYEGLYPRQPECVIAALIESLAGDFAAGVRRMMRAYFTPASDPALVEGILNMMAGAREDVALPALAELLRWDLDLALERVRVPVATLNSAELLTPSALAAYRDRIHIETLAGVGHFLMLERPVEFAARLEILIGRMMRSAQKFQ